MSKWQDPAFIRESNRKYQAAYRQRRDADPARHKRHTEVRLLWYANNVEKARERSRRYSRSIVGMDHVAADALLEKAACCEICGALPTKKLFGGLVADHDHDNGFIRGVLCNKCNRCLAGFHDNPDLLRKAAEYLDAARLKMANGRTHAE